MKNDATGKSSREARQKAASAAQAFVDGDLFTGPSNSEILKGRIDIRSENEYRQKIYQLERLKSRFIWSGAREVNRIQPLTFTSHVRLLHDLEPRLPPPEHGPDKTIQNVYLACRPDLYPRGVIRSFRHWSIYCNGFFYHLTAVNSRDSQPAGLSCNTPDSKDRTVKLKVEDLGTRDSESYLKYLPDINNKDKLPLLAYHIGQTDHTPDELQIIASWIIDRLQSYDFVSSNCQHFALAFCVRTLITRRDCSVFLGTHTQIVEWDLKARHAKADEHRNGFQSGFLLCGVQPSALTYSFDQRSTVLISMILSAHWRRSHFHNRIDRQSYLIYNLWSLRFDPYPPPDSITSYGLWRCWLMFPAVTQNYPQLRRLLLKKEHRNSDQSTEMRTLHA